jgi:hypothetical protein
VKIADFNGDGAPDVASGADTVSVNLNLGNGILGPRTDYAPTTVWTNVIATADFNGDGKVDIAATSGATVSILMNQGNGTFSNKVDYAVLDQAISLVPTDLNGDGKPDLAIVSYSGNVVAPGEPPQTSKNSVSIMLNQGDGTFGPPTVIQLGGTEFYVYGPSILDSSISAADINGDGRIDLLIAPWDLSAVVLLINQGNGTFTTTTMGFDTPHSIAAGDLNGDGWPDMVVISGFPNDHVHVMLNQSNGTFAPSFDDVADSESYGLTLADFNQDGQLDIAYTNYVRHSVSVRLNQSGGVFSAPFEYLSGGLNPAGMTAADMNMDLKMDLVVANAQSHTLTVLFDQCLP